MKAITDKRYEIKENIEQFLTAMNFDQEDIQEVLECQERDPNHSLLLFINENGSTISVTPSDADVYFYILHNERDEDIITETLGDIRQYVDNGCLDELL